MSRFWVKVSVLSCAACVTWLGDGIGARSANASCGDYVHLEGADAKDPSERNSMLQVSRWKEHTEKSQQSRPSDFPGQTCHGPGCRQNDPQSDPIAPVTAPTTPQREFGACAIDETSPTNPLIGVVGYNLPLTTGNGPHSRIERPPRNDF